MFYLKFLTVSIHHVVFKSKELVGRARGDHVTTVRLAHSAGVVPVTWNLVQVQTSYGSLLERSGALC